MSTFLHSFLNHIPTLVVCIIHHWFYILFISPLLPSFPLILYRYYWYTSALQATENIDTAARFNWQMWLCLLLAWFVVYICLFKGIQSSGKVRWWYSRLCIPCNTRCGQNWYNIISYMYEAVHLSGSAFCWVDVDLPEWHRQWDGFP